jgi:hypothetical protein
MFLPLLLSFSPSSRPLSFSFPVPPSLSLFLPDLSSSMHSFPTFIEIRDFAHLTHVQITMEQIDPK